MVELELILDDLDGSRERVLVALEPLPDEALVQPEAIGAWSVADVLVLLTAWESVLVTGLVRLRQGKKPDRLLAALKRREQFAEKLLSQPHTQDLDVVFDDWQRARLRLEEALEGFSARDLGKNGRFKPLGNKSLTQVVAMASFELEAVYAPQLEAFSRQWLADVDGVILLTAVSVEVDDAKSD